MSGELLICYEIEVREDYKRQSSSVWEEEREKQQEGREQKRKRNK